MKLINLICLTMVLVLSTGVIFAADGDFENLKAKRSYCVGLDIGSNFSQGDWDLDIEQLINGIRDAYTGTDWKVEKDEMMRVINEYRTELRETQMKKKQEAAETNKEEGEKFLKENAEKKGVKVTESGLQYEILTEGTGATPKATDQVKVHYRGTLIDGTEFDSSYSRGEPVTFGVDKVIPGWTEALQLMKEGAKWRLYIPSDLAYGNRGAGQSIGPNATLIFDVELLEIVKE
ncbi:MAG TPA: FKBP-type peptidyl-prolyl cis-trans isomerase [bacterium]|nr:FKBP-type peptidyl-prolyl cis-trans isomerase [bacterium]